MAAGLSAVNALFALAVLSGLHPASAAESETLSDPTRPPAKLAQPGESATTRRSVLQSVLITPRERAAIIDGQRVELHGRVGDAEVVQIKESEVVLRSPRGIETLKLYPDVDKVVGRTDTTRSTVVIERKRAIPGDVR